MPSANALAWVERLIWALIYAGLLAVILGIFTVPRDASTGWSLIVAGAVAAAAGVVLIWVRSRLRQNG